MCRLTVVVSGKRILMADITTEPAMSIIRQSYAAQERAQLPPGQIADEVYKVAFLNGDGYGIGWYADGDPLPCVFSSLKPAWNDQNLVNLSQKIRSKIIFAHIRAAGPSTGVSDALCHPFTYGKYLFMHNGCMDGFDFIKRKMLAELDDIPFKVCMSHMCIDSAMAFGVFLNNLPRGPDDDHTTAEMSMALRKTIETFCRHHMTDKQCWGVGCLLMNFVVSCGNTVLATRCAFRITPEGELKASPNPTLYISTGSMWGPLSQAEEDKDQYRMHYEDPQLKTCIISSEPLSASREEWLPVAAHTMVVVRKKDDGTVNVLHVPLEHLPQVNMCSMDMADDIRGRPMPGPLAASGSSRRLARGGSNRLVPSDGGTTPISKMKSSEYAMGGLYDDMSLMASPIGEGSRPCRGVPSSTVSEMGDRETFFNTGGWNQAERMNLVPPREDRRNMEAYKERKHSMSAAYPGTEKSPEFELVGDGEESGEMAKSSDDESGNAMKKSGTLEMDSNTWINPTLLAQPFTRQVRVTELTTILGGCILATGDQEGTLRFWDVHNFKLLCSKNHSANAGAISSLTVADTANGLQCRTVESPRTRGKRASMGAVLPPGFGTARDSEHLSPLKKSPSDGELMDMSCAHGPDDLLFSGSVNELRVWHTINLRTWVSHAYAPSGISTTNVTEDEADVVCLFVFKFLPNLGRVQSLFYRAEADALFAGFQNGALFNFSGFTRSTGTLREAKTRSRGVKFITLELIIPELGPWPVTFPSANFNNTIPIPESKTGMKVKAVDVHNGNSPPQARWRRGRGTAAHGVGNERALTKAHLDLTILSGPTTDHRGVQHGTVTGHFGAINAMHFCGNSFSSTGADGRVLVWPNNAKEPMILVGHAGSVYCVNSRCDAQELYTGGADGNLRVWDVTAGQCIVTLRARPSVQTDGIRPGPILSMSVMDNLVACGHASGILTVWSAATKNMVFQTPVSTSITTFDPFPIGSVAAAMPESAALNSITWIPSSPTDDRFLFATGGRPDGGARLTDLWFTDESGETSVKALEDRINGNLPLADCRNTPPEAEQSKDVKLVPPDFTGLSRPSRFGETESERLLKWLRRFVAIRCVASDTQQCVVAAKMVASLLEQQLGMAVRFFGTTATQAQALESANSSKTRRMSTIDDLVGNPVVVGRLGWDKKKPTVVFYSHYDVQDTFMNIEEFEHDDVHDEKWKIQAENGVIFGCGVADGKGPLLAQVLAVQRWRQKCNQSHNLPVNIVFISQGDMTKPFGKGIGIFKRALDNCIDEQMFDGTTAVVVNHGRWIDATTPSIVYGMRGLLDVEVEISVSDSTSEAKGHGLEERIAGAMLVEPLMDLMSVCGALVESNGLISVPRFYDKVRPISQTDRDAINMAVVADAQPTTNYSHRPAWDTATVKITPADLERVWQQPSISVRHSTVPIANSNGGQVWMRSQSTVEKLTLSCRFVPDQTANEVFEQIKSAVEFQFARRRSPNTLKVRNLQSWSWWEADTSSKAFRAAEDALRQAWKKEPLRMRTGATMAVVGLLEDKLGSPVVQLPFSRPKAYSLAQAFPNGRHKSADQANPECVMLSDLLSGIDVLENFLDNIGRNESESKG